jgi:hypothetical protein
MDARGHAPVFKKKEKSQNVEYGNVSNKSQSHYGNGGFGRYSFIHHERFPSSNEPLIALNLLFLPFMSTIFLDIIVISFFFPQEDIRDCSSAKQKKIYT